MNRVPLTVYSTPACHGYCHHHFGSSSTSFAYQYPSISIFDQVSIAPSFLYVPVPIQQLPSQYAPSYLPTNYSNILPGQSAHLYPNGGSDNPNPFYEPLTTPEMPSPPPRLRRGLRDQNEVVAKKPKTEHNDAAP
uniref:Uncharacterized protein n=1 Tax=Panagrolaimus superbus TaxID=310955 RepID=A0A914YIM6_9BILA